MKDRQGGYVLPLVMVVLTVLCVAAIAVLSFSADQLKSQQYALTRTQLRYAFLGNVERMKNALNGADGTVGEFSSYDEAYTAAEEAAAACVVSVLEDVFDAVPEYINGQWSLVTTMQETGGVSANYVVSAEVDVTVDVEMQEKENDPLGSPGPEISEPPEIITTYAAAYTITVRDVSWQDAVSYLTGGDEP